MVHCVRVTDHEDALFLNVHPYHTKMPPSLIAQFIREHSEQGNLVLDPFCGSGMSGVAGLLEGRRVVLNDLSPAATHIARGYVEPVEPSSLLEAGRQVLEASMSEVGYLYTSTCSECSGPARISYSIWSDVVKCPRCGSEFVLWDQAVDQASGQVKDRFLCPHCEKELNRGRVAGTKVRQEPVVTVYDCMNGCRRKRNEHRTTSTEREVALRLEVGPLPDGIPTRAFMNAIPGEPWGEQWRAGYHAGVTHTHHFFTRRNYLTLGALFQSINELKADWRIKDKLMFTFTGILFSTSKMVKYIASRGGRSNIPGTLYLPALSLEQNPLAAFERRLKKVVNLATWRSRYASNAVTVLTGSATDLEMKDGSVDYVFTDPPFGANIQYAELNFIAETWLGAYTPVGEEIVINRRRKQGLIEYGNLLERSLGEIHRVLKPGHLASMVFHNTDPSVWAGLLKAIEGSGFVVSGVSMLDKGKPGWNQATNEEGSARYDPVIHLQKPSVGVNQRSPLRLHTRVNDILDYLGEHLASIPDAPVRERTIAYLHSISIQYLITQGSVTPPLTLRALEKALATRFVKKDKYWYARLTT